MNAEYVRLRRCLGNRRKILIGIKRQGREKSRIGGIHGRRKEQGMSVRRGFRHHVGRGDAASAAAIVDDDRFAESFAEFLSDCACEYVCTAAGRERHDEPQRFIRIR